MTDKVVFVNATFLWDGAYVTLEYDKGISLREYPAWGRLTRAIGTLHVPVAALKEVALTPPAPGHMGSIQLIPREKSSSLHAVAGCGLPSQVDPLICVFDDDQELLAEYYADEIRSAIALHGLADAPADRFLIRTPERPDGFDGHDGRLHLYKDQVIFHWQHRRAHRGKLSSGPQWRVPLTAVESVTWIPAHKAAEGTGFVQLGLAGAPAGITPSPATDVNSILMRDDVQAVNGALFSASLAQRIEAVRTEADTQLVRKWVRLQADPSGTPLSGHDADPIEKISELARLRDAGVLTEEEFQAKKKELLDRI